MSGIHQASTLISKRFAQVSLSATLSLMTQPLALVLYEQLLPGTQLVNQLQDLGYRVQTVEDPGEVVPTAEKSKPLVLFADLRSTRSNVLDVISTLRKNDATKHIPVVAISGAGEEPLRDSAKASGITLLASEAALSDHLSQILEQALRVD
jgi:CheY-like chemotaxis protein